MPVPNLTLDEILLLRSLVIGEAFHEPDDGQVGVVKVVLNRLKRPGRFGSSIHEIVLKPLQFSCFNAKDPAAAMILKVPYGSAQSLKVIKNVCEALTNTYDPTFAADHYFADYIDPPSWSKNMLKTVKIGRHLFFKE